MKKVFVLTDLGYGDAGKGATTHFLCNRHKAHTVVRLGGAQAAHNVIVSKDGSHHTFSQFGAGTLVGASTHLSQHMVIDPYAIFNEGRALQHMGQHDVFQRLTISRNALVITPFQAITNRLRELARGKNRKGTVGIGVGETVRDSLLLGDGAVRASDFGTAQLPEKLEAIRQLKIKQLQELGIADNIGTLSEEAQREFALLHKLEIVQWAAGEFGDLARFARVVDDSFLYDILRDGVVVFEPSQGVLLDTWYGFHPYTTQLDNTAGDALRLLSEVGYDGEITRLGLIRAYQTRHGAGPFVTESEQWSRLVPDIHNGSDHPWQGKFRVGPLDGVAARYAIEAAGGVHSFDALVVSCVDRLAVMPQWQIADAYRYHGTDENVDDFFTMEMGRISAINVRPNTRDEQQRAYQGYLGELLRQCLPVYTTIANDNQPYNQFLEMISDRLRLPIAVASYGPTEADRIVSPGWENRL